MASSTSAWCECTTLSHASRHSIERCWNRRHAFNSPMRGLSSSSDSASTATPSSSSAKERGRAASGSRTTAASWSIRFGRHHEDFERDRFAAHFAGRNLPIPQVVEVDEALGAWYCISTRAHGTPLEQLDMTEWTATAPSVLATLDALRESTSRPPPATGSGPTTARLRTARGSTT